MTCVLATNNPGKARELRALFACGGVELIALADLGLAFTPEETGGTFAANAAQKALETQAFLRAQGHDFPVLADDSGLCVDALDGAPGVDSALYLGADTGFDVRNAHIISALAHASRRTARFVSVAVCALPSGRVLTTTGTLEGVIAREAQGTDGFGYDPIFYVPEKGRTLAQLSLDEKNEISHRGQAMLQMRQLLEAEALA